MSSIIGTPAAPPSRAAAPPVALRWTAILSAGLAVALWYAPHLLRPDLFDGDAAQHVFWLYRYADPDLFPNDLTVQYFASGSVAPLGYRALYAMLARVLDVAFAAKAVAAVLGVVSAWLAWRIGCAAGAHRGPRVAALMGVFSVLALLVLLPDADLAPRIGFQRAFAMPALLLCVFGLVTRRYRWVGIAWLAAALFYPVLLPLLGIFAGVFLLIELVRERHMPRHWLWNGALGVLAVGIVLWEMGVPDGIGPMVTFEQARRMPEFGPAGRQILFEPAWTEYWIGHHRTGLLWRPWQWIFAVAGAAALTLPLRVRDLVPRAVWILAGCGIALWGLAHAVMFDLYLPNRHSRYALAVFAILAFATAATAAALAWMDRVGTVPVRRAIGLAAPLVAVLAIAPQSSADWKPTWHDLEDAYAFLSELPPATLVAAHPDDADAVPLRTRHSVLASTETSIAFMQGYYDRLKPRIEASLRATYATSWEDFDAQLQPFGVDVFLVTPADWDRTGYFAPWDELAERLLARGRKKGFVLAHPPAGRVLFRSGEVYVVRVGGDHAAG